MALVNIVDNLLSTDPLSCLSANMGRILNGKIEDVASAGGDPEIPGKIASIEESVTDINSDILALNDRMVSTEVKVTTHETAISGLQNAVTNVDESVTNNTESITEINAAIENLETSDSGVIREIETIQDALVNLESKIADSGWKLLPLNAGWSQKDYNTDKPMYRKIGNQVFLRGVVSGINTAGTEIAVLPVGFRPAENTFNRWSCALNQTDHVNIQISNKGVMLDWTKGASQGRTYIALTGITYLTD